MTITYSMRNVTSDLVKTIMLRKFFQMVFIGNDKKSLHIYTATILGASSEAATVQDGGLFVSDFENLRQFRMRFEFAVGGDDNNEVFSIKHEDLTDTKHGFFNEIDCIEKVWGSDTGSNCRILLDNQIQLQKKLNIVTGQENKKPEPAFCAYNGKPLTKTASLAQYKMLWVEQTKSDVEDGLLRALAIHGSCETEVECPKVPNVRDDGSVRKAYAISIPKDIVLPAGIELVNWVRTTIQFRYDIDDSDLNYIIKKDITDKEESTRYFAPDFTWYFSPTAKSFIDNRNSMVEVKRRAKEDEKASETCICTCPSVSNCPHQRRRGIYVSDKYQNSIDTVPNKLTVHFHHWTKEEQIGSRQKYRLSAKDILPSYQEFDELSEINIFLDMADEHSRGNRQFILALFISFALAFCIDSSRLEQVQYYFSPLTHLFPVDVWWITFLTLFSLTLISKPSKFGDKSRKMMKKRRRLLNLSLIWAGAVFLMFRSPVFEFLGDQIAEILHNVSRELVLRTDTIKFFNEEFLQRALTTESIKGFLRFCLHNLSGLILAGLIVLQCLFLHANKISPNDNLFVELFGKDIL